MIFRTPSDIRTRRRRVNGMLLLAGVALLMTISVAPSSAEPEPAPLPPDPVLVNPSFEEVAGDGTVPGWEPLTDPRPGTSHQVTDAKADTGERSLELVDDSETNAIGLESDPFPVTAGAAYTARAMMNVERDRLAIYLRYYDAAGTRLTNASSWRDATGGAWAPAAIAAPVPDGAVTGTVVVYSSTGDTGHGWVDSVTVRASEPEPPPLVDPTPEEIVAQNPRISHLGSPVLSKIITNSVLGEEDGVRVVYGTYRGHPDTENPATFVVANADTGEVIRSLPAAGAEGTFETRKSTDGRIYFATTPDFKLWSYDPATKQLRSVGLINSEVPKEGHAFTMTAGENGSMYIGTYPKGYVYHYDPADDAITNLGSFDETQAYVKGLAYDFERKNLYVGVGGTRAQIYKISPDGSKKALLSEETTPGAMDEAFISTFTFVGDRLFARGGSSQLLVIKADDTVEYWKNQGKEMFGYHVSERPDAPGRFVFTFGTAFWEYDSAARTTRNLGIATNAYLNDSRWIELDDPAWPGASMLAATQEGTVLMNPETGKSELREVAFGNPVTVQKLLTGPDSLYASGYMVGLTPFDSTTGEPGETLQSGQYESAAVRGRTMLLGAYGNGRVSVYDPASGAAPKLIFDLKAEHQDRPFAMDYDEEHDRLFVGTVPYYGRNQGALTGYDFGSATKTVYTTELITEQSVISVLYHDGLVYVGTTLDGGLGAPPSGQTEAHFIVFDPATGRKVQDLVPVAGDEGVTGLMLGPDGLIWGVSEDTVFKYDPAQGKIVFSQKLLGNRYGSSTVWAWAYLGIGADGNVYGTNRRSLFRIEPATMTYTKLVNGVGNYLAVDPAGDLLFSHGVHVYRFDLEEPVVCDRELTGSHTGPITVDRGTTCLTGATVTGSIEVRPGASLVITDSRVTGRVQSSGAAMIKISGSTVVGQVTLAGTDESVIITGNEFTGPLTLTDSATTGPAIVGGNTVIGILDCTGNEPPPADDGNPNTASVARHQCAGLA